MKEHISRSNNTLNPKISTGLVHEIPYDFRELLSADTELCRLWNNLTPLARNEWICWIISVKKPETRQKHIERACSDILSGKRRPCCWPGCPHR